MKTHFKKLRNPNYLGAWDLSDEKGETKNKIVTITEVKKDQVFDGNGKQEECVVMHFQGLKPMVMNATNLKTVSKVLQTPFIEEWAGKKIELTVRKVKAFGDVHDALRVVEKRIVVEQVDVKKCISILDAAKSLDELKSNWASLNKDEQGDPLVVKRKDELKANLTPKTE
jgi:hypothetical protein